jgi:hypothetical protein
MTTKQEEQAMKDELARLRAENKTLKAAAQAKITLKVAKKGGVSLYGMGRFPITLYKTQWEQVLGMKDTIEAFIADNAAKLSKGKDDARFAETAVDVDDE